MIARRSEQRRWLGAALAATLLTGILAAVVSGFPIGLLIVGPLIAAVRLSARQIAAVGALTLVLWLPFGLASHSFLSARHFAALAVVASGGALAVLLGAMRARADAERTRLSLSVEREQLLLDAGSLLDTTLDPSESLRRLARLPVPEHAQLCVIDLVDEEGRIRGAAVVAHDSGTAEGLARLRVEQPLDPEGPHPVARVLRTGRAELLGDMDRATLASFSSGDEHLAFMLDHGYRSAIVAPLRARGEMLGALSVLRMRDAPRYSESDFTLIEELAARAALAVSNARLYDDAVRRRRASDFLAQASVVLDSSLDVEETMRGFAQLVVPNLADWCAIDTLEGGEIRNVVTTHRDPGKLELADELRRRWPPSPDAPTGPAAVLRGGPSELYREIPEDLLQASAADEEHLAALRALQMQSAIVVPLGARGRRLAALTLVVAESERRLGHEELHVAEELARRAGMALDNARLYRERSQLASTLQSSLLPPQLPRIEGLELAARYHAATGEGNEVGGDFYDVFSTAPARWLVVVGDVCGKGAPAAALTAMVRYTLRAAAAERVGPREALLRLNAAMLRWRREPELRFATLVCIEIDLSSTPPRATLSLAGHPAPLLLRAAGSCEPLGEAGTIIGVFDDPRLEQCMVELSPGDSLVLYTDGVTEADRARVRQPEGLSAPLTASAGAGAEAIADHLQQIAGVGDEANLRDDVAILVVRATGLPRAERPASLRAVRPGETARAR